MIEMEPIKISRKWYIASLLLAPFTIYFMYSLLYKQNKIKKENAFEINYEAEINNYKVNSLRYDRGYFVFNNKDYFSKYDKQNDIYLMSINSIIYNENHDSVTVFDKFKRPYTINKKENNDTIWFLKENEKYYLTLKKVEK